MYGTSIGDLKIVVPTGPSGDKSASSSSTSSSRYPTVHLERIRVGPARPGPVLCCLIFENIKFYKLI